MATSRSYRRIPRALNPTNLNQRTKEFINFLTNLDYPGVSDLQPEKISWAYENLETRNILNWLCTNIDIEQNVLDVKDDWIKEIESIENEVDSKQNSQEHLSYHIEQLELTLKSIEEKYAELKRVSRDLDEKNKEVDKNIEQDSVKYDVDTAAVVKTVAQVLSERKFSEGKGKQQKNFIYQCTDEIDEIMNSDQSFTSELQQLCEIFFSNEDIKKFQSYNLADEVIRLKNLYPRTQIKYIKASTEFEYLSTYLRVFQNEATRVRMDFFIPGCNVLKSNIEQNTNKNSLLNEQINNVVDSINGLLSKLTYLEIESPILTADCEVKLQYQQNFIDQLEMVIDRLLLQYAHNEFVAQIFHIELDNQKAVHRLLSNLRDKLERRAEDFSKRMLLMSASDFVEPTSHKTMVESRDDFLLSLKKMLNLDLSTSYSKEDKSLPFTTYDSLRERLKEVENARNTSFDRFEQEWKAQQKFLESCGEIENFLTSLLYKDSKTSEFLITPQELSDLQFLLRAKANNMQPRINHASKNLNLPEHLESEKERFIRFFAEK
ncbi:hypothetical protein RhiirA5_465232 [Rhizophagus irregularis]|uniref:Haus augmin-like complex subunit 3 n=1 Tax=Rhizophagus irregularis TaxID=588596 RepID=A0A2I1DZL1_9GLOM|nr:hypothetical protein RhiirA5_465232 [Rhizophagus irregularis]PKC68859.1 hypothetical protein RhiirA1_506080 [Rhizophagus irregularis]PKY15295.1 hypothetical protein RhiirB3_512155 [Rhizophagus irregularis]